MHPLRRFAFLLVGIIVLALRVPTSALPVMISGTNLFSDLDGGPLDDDHTVNGTFTVNGSLLIDGTITCNDDPPLADSADACPIKIVTTGDLEMLAGSAIYAENRRAGGSGGDITLTVGGN